MFMFRTLPFYAKYGAIPESYLIALSYEEQLLWLCKFIEDLDEKIDSSFVELQNYINEALLTKQDLLIAGENITIKNNVISAETGEDLTPNLITGYRYAEYEMGDILPENPVAINDTAYYQIGAGLKDNKLKLSGKYEVYEIDPETREILAILNSAEENYIYTIQTNGIVIANFDDIDVYPAKLILIINYYNQIQQLSNAVDYLDNEVTAMGITKQDKLTAGENITIVDNVISATGGSTPEVTILTQDIILQNGVIPEYETGWYYTNYATIGIQTQGAHSTDVFSSHQLVYYDSDSMTFTGGIRSIYYDINQWTYKMIQGIDNLLGDSQSAVPTSYAVSQALLEKLNNKAYYLYDNLTEFTSLYYFDLSLVFINDTIPAPTFDSHAQYIAIPVAYLDTNTFRITGECSSAIWFTCSGDLLGGTATLLSKSNEDIGYTNETLDIEIPSGADYLVIQFTSNNVTIPSLERVNIVQTISGNIDSNNDNKVPTCGAVYRALGNIQTGIPNVTTGTTSTVTGIWSGTQTEYNNLSGYDSTTLYFIKE